MPLTNAWRPYCVSLRARFIACPFSVCLVLVRRRYMFRAFIVFFLQAFSVSSSGAHILFSVHSSFIFQPSFKPSLFVHSRLNICFALALRSNKMGTTMTTTVSWNNVTSKKYILYSILVGIYANYMGSHFGSLDVMYT